MSLGHTSSGIPIATTRLSLVWIIKELSQLEWIGEHLRAMLTLAPKGLFGVDVHVTAEKRGRVPEAFEGYVTRDWRFDVDAVGKGGRLEIHDGRPDFDKVVQREVEATGYSE